MTSVGVFDVRRLVEEFQDLRSPVAPKTEHPLGLGLQQSHSLSLGEGIPRLRIPKTDAGLAELRALISQDVLDLTAEEKQAAWRLLMAKPRLCVPLETPSVQQLCEAGFIVPEEAQPRVRAVGLAAVFIRQASGEPAPSSDDPVPPSRIAAIGRLVVVTGPNPGLSTDAWADIHWVRSARAFSRELEALYKVATPSARKSGSRRSAVLVLGDELADSIDEIPDDSIEQVLSEAAAVHSYNLRILRSPRRFMGNVVEAVRTTPPSLLVLAAPSDASVEAACEAYRKAASAPSISHLGKVDRHILIDDFREALAAARGVNPALQLKGSIKAAADIEMRPQDILAVPGIWPVVQEGQRKILNGIGSFIESLEDGYWYTRDKAGHAGSVIKRYRRVGRNLEHVADIAIDGSVIPKHKGSATQTLSLDEMRGA